MAASGGRSRSARASPTSEWPAYGRKLTALAERMAEFGVGMAFHHHMGTIVETDEEVGRLMATTGEAVGLLFDTGHCAFSGGDPVALLDAACRPHRARPLQGRRGRRCCARRAPTDMSFMEAVMDGIFTVPGDGCDRLSDDPAASSHDAGYAGWLVVEAEQDPAKAHPLTYATLGYRNLAAAGAGGRLHGRDTSELSSVERLAERRDGDDFGADLVEHAVLQRRELRRSRPCHRRAGAARSTGTMVLMRPGRFDITATRSDI